MPNLAVSDDETRQLAQSSNSLAQEFRPVQVGEMEKPQLPMGISIEKPRVSEKSA
ncbi:hypothetical protein FRC01_008086, partial [Tulasnella sp. 417]